MLSTEDNKVTTTEAPTLADGTFLRLMRVQAGYTRQELADALDVKPRMVTLWEHGRKPIPLARWPQIRAALDRGLRQTAAALGIEV